jgi:hypothetical protein
MTTHVETIWEVARTPGIYAMYGGEHIGAAGLPASASLCNLHHRLEQHVIRPNSSVVTGTSAGASISTTSLQGGRERQSRAPSSEAWREHRSRDRVI